MSELSGKQDQVSSELADVAWPWNVNDTFLSARYESLSGTLEEIDRAIDSLRALLSFLERHGSKAKSAIAAMPELDEMYWGLMRPGFDEIMPTMADFTWSNFRRWVTEHFHPSWIGASWDDPPQELVEAVGWIWANGVVDGARHAVTNWLIDYFRRVSEPFGIADFLEIVTTFIPKVGPDGAELVGVAGCGGGRKALPFYARLLKDATLLPEVRDEVEHWLDYCSKMPVSKE